MNLRVLSAFFAFIMLLSSGVVQVAMHICPEEGINIMSDCGMHEQLPKCCKQNQTESEESHQNCCQDAYVFAVTPKFGAVEKCQIQNPAAFILSDLLKLQDQCTVEPEITGNRQGDAPPLPFNRDLQQRCCTWVI